MWGSVDESWVLLAEECVSVCVAEWSQFPCYVNILDTLWIRGMGRGHRVGRVLRFFSSRPFGSWRRVTLDEEEKVGESQFRRGDMHCGTPYIYMHFVRRGIRGAGLEKEVRHACMCTGVGKDG